LVEDHANVILRKVNIVNWESEAAQQAAQEFNLQGIPYVRVYDGRGKFVDEVSGGDIGKIKNAVRTALAR
jgi:hypothetical protein